MINTTQNLNYRDLTRKELIQLAMDWFNKKMRGKIIRYMQLFTYLFYVQKMEKIACPLWGRGKNLKFYLYTFPYLELCGLIIIITRSTLTGMKKIKRVLSIPEITITIRMTRMTPMPLKHGMFPDNLWTTHVPHVGSTVHILWHNSLGLHQTKEGVLLTPLVKSHHLE